MRYPVILSSKEKAIAKKVVHTFKVSVILWEMWVEDTSHNEAST